MEQIVCPICELSNEESFYDKERKDNPVNFVICRKCGLVYENPRKTEEEYKKYYQTAFRDEKLEGEALTNYINSRIEAGNNIYKLVKRTFSCNKINFLKQFLNGNKQFSVLDVGCGVGGILVPFKQAGFRCKGIDTPSFYTSVGKEKLGIDIEEGFLEDIKIKEKYDIIILNHVLEHFLNPIQELNEIRSILKDNGILYVEIPDLERPYNWTSLKYFFLLGHVFYYSPETLGILMNKCGFERIFLENEKTPFMINIFKKKKDFTFEIDPFHSSKLIQKFNKLKEEKNDKI